MAYSEAIRNNFKKLKTTDWHFLWVILFFVIHGYTQYLQLVPLGEVLWLLVKLGVSGIIGFWLSCKIFKSKRKAGIFTSFALIMILFFGVMQDLIAEHRPIAFFSSLRVFVAFILLLFIVVFICLKLSDRRFIKTVIMKKITLFDLSGKQLKTLSGNKSTFNFSFLTPGIYLLEIIKY